jgi:undecaprenyl-diphosphatase
VEPQLYRGAAPLASVVIPYFTCMETSARQARADISRWWILAIAASIVFAILAVGVTTDSPLARFDRDFANALDANATPELREFFKSITLLGTGWALGIASGVVGVALLVRRHIRLAIAWTIAQGGSVVLVKIVKAIVARDRPGLGDPEFYAHGWSFPSGHVVRTFVFVAMAAYLVFRLTGSRAVTTAVCLLGFTWCVAMAASRLYLGAHFASDVTGAMLLGTAWVAACIAVAEGRRAS